jgi:hypothetical protein
VRSNDLSSSFSSSSPPPFPPPPPLAGLPCCLLNRERETRESKRARARERERESERERDRARGGERGGERSRVIKEGRREKRGGIEDGREHRHEINSGSIEWGGRGHGSGNPPLLLLLTSPPLSSVRSLRSLRRVEHVTILLNMRCLCLLNMRCLCLLVLLGMSYLRFI